MHKEHEIVSANATRKKSALPLLLIGIVLVISGLVVISLTISGTKFGGLEKYYDQYGYVFYIVAAFLLLLGQIAFSKVDMSKRINQDSDFIIR